MSKLWKRIAGLLGNRSMAGVDKAGNRYFARTEQMDGVMKEKRWVVFKGEEDPTSIPVEWICWLNGQRKKAPTLEEMMELEAKRERVRLNVARKVGGPDLRSFIQQFPADSKGDTVGGTSGAMDGMRNSEESETDKEVPSERKRQPEYVFIFRTNGNGRILQTGNMATTNMITSRYQCASPTLVLTLECIT
ncbi:hypothetical protein RHMOL_Rhmol06G0298000 [Rhododendron molle]|uniref:Uncharacterized protein n=1 Tax=Rhododendron molle TaxID=49168 RepID=A0ACC0NHS6_RHOML|nr:hypothetical protein RHMOL_Rhmol06G0298000 [Rhododendron molle]